MRKLILLILTTTISILCYSQKQNTAADTINHIIKSNVADSVKAQSLYQLAKSFISKDDSAHAADCFFEGIKICTSKKLYSLSVYGYGELAYLYELAGDYAKAIKYYTQASKIGLAHNDILGAARNYQNKNFIYATIGEIQKSITTIDTAVVLYKKVSADKNICECYNILGLRYHALKNDSLAVLNLNKAMNLAEQLSVPRLSINPLINIGLVFLDNRQFDIARMYFLNAKKIVGDKPSKNLAIINNNLGIIAYEKKQLQDAIAIYKENEIIAKAVKANALYTMALNNLASCYTEMNDFPNAEKYFQLSLQEKIKQSEVEGIAINYINYAELLRKQKKLDEAIKMANQANGIIVSHEGLTKLIPSVYEILAICYKEKGDLRTAFDYLDSQYVAKDKIINERSNKMLLELQTKYETEKKDLRINVLAKADSIKSLQIQNQQLEITDQFLDLSNKKLLLSKDSVNLALKDQSIQKNKIDSVFQEQRIRQLNREKQIQLLEIQNKKLEIRQKNLAIAAAVLFSLFATLFIYNKVKIRAKQKEVALQHQLEQEKKAAAEKVILAEENERQRISRDLHDNMGAYTTALLSNVQQLKLHSIEQKVVEKMEDNAQQILSSLRETIWMLNNKEISVSDLSDTFKNYCFKLLQNFDTIHFEAEESIENDKIIPAVKAIHLYKILQESFQNIMKHANASFIRFSLQSGDKLEITVADNGKGFISGQKSFGNGLGNMRWRAEEAGFMLAILSEQNIGTQVKISEI